MAEHELKTWPDYFRAIVEGRKTFEVRLNDRGFAVGDRLVLVEYDPAAEALTGRRVRVDVTYLLTDPDFGVKPGYAVLGFCSVVDLPPAGGPAAHPFTQPSAAGRSSVRDDLSGPGPVFAARYAGVCGECGDEIEPDDSVRMVNGAAEHAECVEDAS